MEVKIHQSYTDCQGVNPLLVSIRLKDISIPIYIYSLIKIVIEPWSWNLKLEIELWNWTLKLKFKIEIWNWNRIYRWIENENSSVLCWLSRCEHIDSQHETDDILIFIPFSMQCLIKTEYKCKTESQNGNSNGNFKKLNILNWYSKLEYDIELLNWYLKLKLKSKI